MKYRPLNDLIDPEIVPESHRSLEHDPDAPNDSYVIGENGATVKAPEVAEGAEGPPSDEAPRRWVRPSALLLSVAAVALAALVKRLSKLHEQAVVTGEVQFPAPALLRVLHGQDGAHVVDEESPVPLAVATAEAVDEDRHLARVIGSGADRGRGGVLHGERQGEGSNQDPHARPVSRCWAHRCRLSRARLLARRAG